MAFSSLVQAQEPADLHVEWYRPEIRVSERKFRSRVLISGKTTPGARVTISHAQIPLIRANGDVASLSTKEVLVEPEVFADDRGLFEMNFELPRMSVQLPIEVSHGDVKRHYHLALAVERDNVHLTNQKEAKNSPYARRRWGIWAGLGVNYLKYEQTSDDIPSSLTMESFDLPTLYGKIAYAVTPRVVFQATANRAPGRTSSSTSVQISSGTYNWTFLTGDFTFYHPRWKFRYKKYFSEIGVQFGLQYHLVPFFARSSITDPTAVAVETNDILLTAVGMTWLIHYDRYWLFETFMRYQVPHYAGNLFDIRYKTAFDGSVGIIYKWKPDWRMGVFWYGQYHNYRFDNHKDTYFAANGGNGPYISGDQTLLFSNIEARVGWEFD